MIKKLCVASSLLLLASTAFADFNPAPYVGGGIGIVTHADKQLGVYRGLPFEVFAGYGGLITRHFYLSGELGATLLTAELGNNSYGLETNRAYMFSVLPGVLINNSTIGFVRAGILRTWFESPKESTYGLRLGFGLQTEITPNLSVRGEYDLTVYQEDITRTSVYGLTLKRSPRSDGGNLDFIYKFA